MSLHDPADMTAHAIGAILAHAAEDPAQPAVVAEDGAAIMSRGALDGAIRDTGLALGAAGARPGDRVLLVAPQGPVTAVALLALTAHLPVIPVAPGPAAGLGRFVDQLGPRFLALAGEPGPELQALMAAAGIALLRLSSDPATGNGVLAAPPHAPGAGDALPLAGAGDTGLILPTSGTTGRPKIVALTHAQLGHMAQSAARTLGLTAADRVVNPMPMHHVHGICIGTFLPLASGGSTVPLTSTAGAAVIAAAARSGATWYSAVPTIHQDVVRAARLAPPAPGALRLRFARSSSSALPESAREGLMRHLGIPVYEGLGMTEAASWLLSQPAGPAPLHGTVGRGQGVEVAVMDAAGRIAADPGREGELLVRGPNVITAYLDAGDGDADGAFRDGWLRTGDRVRLTATGEVTVVGRLKEMVDRGGAAIAPVEVEEALMTHPGVAAAIAFGVPHPTMGQDLAAAVVLAPGAAPVTGPALRAWMAGRVGAELVPRVILLRDAIPLNAVGKPARMQAATILAAELRGASGPPEGPVETVLADVIAELVPGAWPGREDDLFLLGFDSLLLLRLQLRLEEMFGATPTADAITADPSIAGLARLVADTARPAALATLLSLWDGAPPTPSAPGPATP